MPGNIILIETPQFVHLKMPPKQKQDGSTSADMKAKKGTEKVDTLLPGPAGKEDPEEGQEVQEAPTKKAKKMPSHDNKGQPHHKEPSTFTNTGRKAAMLALGLKLKSIPQPCV